MPQAAIDEIVIGATESYPDQVRNLPPFSENVCKQRGMRDPLWLIFPIM